MKQSLEETARRFDEMADEYDESSTEWLTRAQQVVLESSRPKEGERAIDLGTGTGVLAKGLAPRLKEVIAIDISVRMLEKVDSHKLPNVKTLLASFDDFEPNISGHIDLVVSNFAMHHLDQIGKAKAIKSISSVLSPKGRFVLGDLMFFEETT
ncbi:MAG: class I SAM-dependent methyltransferase, partial [Planctomycetota bacterium]|nr:class I SAM-dependent methyltransferase [Planctomycetota bacterium]